jgi:oxygen-dependent protoporphyrinogen oxidase
MKIAIIGAGISGLTAAYHLQKVHQVTVFERRDCVGGNILTGDMAGCRVEWGPNGFLDNEPATLELVRELGLEGRVVRARKEAAHRFIWRDGSLRQLPSSPLSFLSSDCLPLFGRLRALREPLSNPAPSSDESVHAFATRRLGHDAAGILVDAMVTGIFAGDPKRLSLKSSFPKIHALEAEHGSLIKGAIKSKGGGMRSRLTSFDEGLSVLTNELARRLDVRLGESMESLPKGFDHTVITTPAPRSAALLDAEHNELAELLRRIPTAPVVVVALMMRSPLKVADAFGFLVPRDQGLRILGTLYSSSIFEHRAPDGFRLFRVLLGGRRDPGVVKLSDGEILDIVARDLHQAWGTFPDPHATKVFRHSLGIAQYEVGHADLLRQIDATRPPWLRLAGSSYRGVALNACVREARTWRPEDPH